MRASESAVRVIAAMGVLAGTTLGFAQQQSGEAPKGEKTRPSQTILAFERAALPAFAVDGKDAGLRRAIAMIPERLDELPVDVPDLGADNAVLMRLIATTLARPSRFALAFTPNNQKAGLMGYAVVMSTPFANAKDADELHRAVMGAIGRAEGGIQSGPSARYPGMIEFKTPGAPLVVGPRVGKNGPGYDIIFGGIADPDAPFEAMPKATTPGIEPFVVGNADFAPLATAIGLLSSTPDTATIGRDLAAFGVIGADAMKVNFEMGYTKDAFVSRMVVRNPRKALEKQGTWDKALTPADLAIVPSDATYANVSFYSLGGILEQILDNPQARGEFEQVRVELQQATGVDVVDDVIGTLKGVGAYYLSDATGGGSLGSFVGLMELADPARFSNAHTRLVAFLRGRAAQEADPFVRRHVDIRKWTDAKLGDATALYSLQFRGVPVPLELTYAISPRFLIVGLTPQAVVAAARQATGLGDKGILSRPGVETMAGKDDRLLSWSFSDTPRMLRSGYPLLSLAGSALANGVRQPEGERDPGMIVPLYADLAAGARFATSATYLRGEVLHLDAIGDRSLSVNLGAAAGTLVQLTPVLLAGGAAIAGFVQGRGNLMGDAGFGPAFVQQFAAGPNDWRAIARDPLGAMQPEAWSRRVMFNASTRLAGNAGDPALWFQPPGLVRGSFRRGE